ncbi:hypothetical protein LTR78_008658 [Recurvomyces mirabilis]|uniref:Programmed cell death protein 2 C-terminal domain-containing protein n=2 Tax=Recurvomyces mirabilis TaxID=574656 RepID=A0AAE0TQS5_9PEZI|nr:hypothetical protein LTR78_008658 [Recurvomyces mirabilis]
MADYDSESSGAEDVETNVLLGYASKEPTSDEFSQLGGHPTWVDGLTAPNGTFAKCKVCNGLMNLLLQLHGDLPQRFPGHERRLYIWSCRRKTCRRKGGSVRALRAVRSSAIAAVSKPPAKVEHEISPPSKPSTNLGETLFGVQSSSGAPSNLFASSNGSGSSANPFAPASAKPVPKSDDTESLAQTFAEKARITPPEPAPSIQAVALPPPNEPWPDHAAFPEPYPAYHLDADKEYLEPEVLATPANARLDDTASNGAEGTSTADMKDAFESSMDKTFQRFADRLSQNPEQVLRYEIGAQPVLYALKDAVGKLLAPTQEQNNAKVRVASSSKGSAGALARVPRCTNCGSARIFELQLTPHLITELEADEMGVEGMDWGTIILAVCSADCQPKDSKSGELSYVEEWVGVQWEDLEEKRRP